MVEERLWQVFAKEAEPRPAHYPRKEDTKGPPLQPKEEDESSPIGATRGQASLL